MLEVSGLSKSYKTVKAVKNFSFKVGNREVLGLIGPNGAGKTTALRCICHILRPDSGKILINGNNITTHTKEAKKELAFVPEIPNPYMYLTVEEHVEFSARLFQLKNWQKRADEMIYKFDLDDKRKELINYLSKGQKQKVNVICAFLHNPSVLLLDEPIYGIDPKGGRYLKNLINNARKNGASIVISSHSLSLVEEVATRILIMSKGEKIIEGTIEKIIRKAKMKKSSKLEDVFLEITEDGRGAKE